MLEGQRKWFFKWITDSLYLINREMFRFKPYQHETMVENWEAALYLYVYPHVWPCYGLFVKVRHCDDGEMGADSHTAEGSLCVFTAILSIVCLIYVSPSAICVHWSGITLWPPPLGVSTPIMDFFQLHWVLQFLSLYYPFSILFFNSQDPTGHPQSSHHLCGGSFSVLQWLHWHGSDVSVVLVVLLRVDQAQPCCWRFKSRI